MPLFSGFPLFLLFSARTYLWRFAAWAALSLLLPNPVLPREQDEVDGNLDLANFALRFHR